MSKRMEGTVKHSATVRWERAGAAFTDNRYSRRHEWVFDGGAVVVASSSPGVVPLPMSDQAGVDPEEAFVASLSSCHMLWFLAIAARRGFVVDSYNDEAEGLVEPVRDGKLAVTVITLRPGATFGGDAQPTIDEIRDMHHAAHGECFIARSVKADVRCEPVVARPDVARATDH